MPISVEAIDRPEAPSHPMPDGFLREVVYFMADPIAAGVPKLGEREYFIFRQQAQDWLDDGFLSIVSPLDAATKAEIELSEEQEGWLEWMVLHDVQHIRLK